MSRTEARTERKLPRRFRPGVRDMLWLLVLVSVCAAWWASHRLQSQQIEQLKVNAGFRASDFFTAAHVLKKETGIRAERNAKEGWITVTYPDGRVENFEAEVELPAATFN